MHEPSHSPQANHPQEKYDEVVVLVHGLLNWPFFMKHLASTLKETGYRVINWGYPSTKHSIETHAEALGRMIGTIQRTTQEKTRIHFVGFSLGAIVIRCYLRQNASPPDGRFVMIGPPNHGSELADKLYPYRLFRLLYGTQITAQLRASNHAFWKSLGTPPLEFGIIAGSRGKPYNDNDGPVTVQSARLEGAQDFILLKHRHMTLLFSPTTRKNVVSFLLSGRFIRSLE